MCKAYAAVITAFCIGLIAVSVAATKPRSCALASEYSYKVGMTQGINSMLPATVHYRGLSDE